MTYSQQFIEQQTKYFTEKLAEAQKATAEKEAAMRNAFTQYRLAVQAEANTYLKARPEDAEGALAYGEKKAAEGSAAKQYAAAQAEYKASQSQAQQWESAQREFLAVVDQQSQAGNDPLKKAQAQDAENLLAVKKANLEKHGIYGDDATVANIKNQQADNQRAESQAGLAEKQIGENARQFDKSIEVRLAEQVSRETIAASTLAAQREANEISAKFKAKEIDLDTAKTELTRVFNNAQLAISKINQMASAAGAIYQGQITQRGQSAQMASANTSFAASTGNAAIDAAVKLAGWGHGGKIMDSILGKMIDHCRNAGGCKELPEVPVPELLKQLSAGTHPDQQAIYGAPSLVVGGQDKSTVKGPVPGAADLTKTPDEIVGSQGGVPQVMTTDGEAPVTPSPTEAPDTPGLPPSYTRPGPDNPPPLPNQSEVAPPQGGLAPIPSDLTELAAQVAPRAIQNSDANQSTAGGVGGITINVNGGQPAPAAPAPAPPPQNPLAAMKDPKFQSVVAGEVSGILNELGFDPDVISQYQAPYMPQAPQVQAPENAPIPEAIVPPNLGPIAPPVAFQPFEL